MESITVKDGDKEITILIKKPTRKEKEAAKIYSNEIFSKLINSKNVVLRANLAKHMKELGLWDDDKEKELQKLNKEVEDLEAVFRKGGIGKNAAKAKAIELRKKRFARTFLLAETYRLDSLTLEGQVENAEFDALVSLCLHNDEGKLMFASVDEYLENADKEHIARAAEKMASTVYGLNEDYRKDLPENKFLLDYGFCDEKLRLVNSDKKLVNEQGKFINENGQLLNEKGELIDEDGNLVDEQGKRKEEFQPFTDD